MWAAERNEMLIAFVGDVHGRIFHALAALTLLQARMGAPFDLIVQVGDLGYPDPERADEPAKRYLAADPAEAGLSLLVQADGPLAGAIEGLRTSLGPIVFVRGNHEDFAWLEGLAVDPATGTAQADPFDLLRYVPDGTVLDVDGLRIAFLGGVEELPGAPGIDGSAYDTLMNVGHGGIDLLVTHEGPYGSSTGYHGDVHGSPLISTLVERVQPRFHVFGHGHTLAGPERSGETLWLGLDALVASAIWHPEARGLKSGCLGVLDTSSGELRPVTDGWLSDFPTPFDFEGWYRSLRNS